METETLDLPSDLETIKWLQDHYAMFADEHEFKLDDSPFGAEFTQLDWEDTFKDIGTDRWEESEYHSSDVSIDEEIVSIRRYDTDPETGKKIPSKGFSIAIGRAFIWSNLINDDEADEDGVYGYQYSTRFERIQICRPYTGHLWGKNTDPYRGQYVFKWLLDHGVSISEAAQRLTDFSAYIVIMALSKYYCDNEYEDFKSPCVRVHPTDESNIVLFTAAGYSDLIKARQDKEYDLVLEEFYPQYAYQYIDSVDNAPVVDVSWVNNFGKLNARELPPYDYNPNVKAIYSATTSLLDTTVHVLSGMEHRVMVTVSPASGRSTPENRISVWAENKHTVSLHIKALYNWIIKEIDPHADIWWRILYNDYLYKCRITRTGEIIGLDKPMNLHMFGLHNRVKLLSR